MKTGGEGGIRTRGRVAGVVSAVANGVARLVDTAGESKETEHGLNKAGRLWSNSALPGFVVR